MFSYVVSFIVDRTEHPVMFTAFIFSAAFLVAAAGFDVFTNNDAATGFLFIYAIMAAALGLLGYGVLFASKAVSKLRDRAMQGV